VVVIYVNNDKIPLILSATTHNSITFMSNINTSKRKLNLFNSINNRFCLDINKKLTHDVFGSRL